MKIRKAVLTAAKPSQSHLPLQTMTDRDGYPRSTLALQLSELIDGGIETVGLVIPPGHEDLYRDAAGDLAERVRFLVQTRPRGFGGAVLEAKEFVGDEAFLLAVGDHLFLSDEEGKSCAKQLIEVAERADAPVASVQSTHEGEIGQYGTIGGTLENREKGTFRIRRIVEKPTPTQAEQELHVPGLRAGHYLCFFGMHVLPPRVFELLEADRVAGGDGNIALSPSLERLVELETFLAFEMHGRRFNLEGRHGLLIAQLALALGSRYREEVLEHVVRLMARE